MPLAAAIESANCHDMNLVGPTLDGLDQLTVKRPEPSEQKPQGLCMEKGYDYPIVRELCECFKLTPHIQSRGQEVARIKREGYKPRRWVVERTHSWMNRFRRLLIRWEKNDFYYEQLVRFACGLIACQQAGLFE